MLASAWYRRRLKIQQQRDMRLAQRQVAYLEAFLAEADTRCEHDERQECEARLARARARLAEVESPAYVDSLYGGLGADWVHDAAA